MLDLASRIPFAALAGIPALVILVLVDRLDAHGGEQRWLLRRVTLLGAVTVIPVLAIELGLALAGLPVRGQDAWTVGLASIAIAALPEEAGKTACLKWLMARRLELATERDGVRYGARIGLGFALVENVLYGLLVADAKSFVLLMAARAVLTVPMHAMWGAVIGHFAARRHVADRGPGIAAGLVIAVIGHALFNFGLGIAELADARGDAPGFVAAIALTLAVSLMSVLLVRRFAREALVRDAEREAAGDAEAYERGDGARITPQ